MVLSKKFKQLVEELNSAFSNVFEDVRSVEKSTIEALEGFDKKINAITEYLGIEITKTKTKIEPGKTVAVKKAKKGKK